MSSTADITPARIVFLAGPKDHGGPGHHEYERDLRLLSACLERSPNLQGLRTTVIVGRVPRDLAAYKDASTLVIHSSSDRDSTETHPLFPPEQAAIGHDYDAETLAFLEGLDGLVHSGLGIVVFHYASWVEHWVARSLQAEWTGGLWVQSVSQNPVDRWSMTFPNPGHPVLRGVRPWTYEDEVFCRFFLPTDRRRTDLLVATPERHPVGPQVAAWAYQRDDGGRAFVMGGVHFHDNLANVGDFRRFLLNGIVWAAGREVPEGGVECSMAGVPQESV